MDYKDFKKIRSDKTCTTLQHKAGHLLKIAHEGLSPKMREGLAKLPLHKAVGGAVDPDVDSSAAPQQQQQQTQQKKGGLFAKGGKVRRYEDGGDVQHGATGSWDDDSSDSRAPSGSPININIGTPDIGGVGRIVNPQQAPPSPTLQPGMPGSQVPAGAQVAQSAAPAAAPQVQARQPVQQSAPQAPDDDNQDDSDQPDDQAQPQAQARQPAQQAAPVAQDDYQKAYNDYKQAHLKEFAEQDAAFDQDLKNGHITPETYHSMFAKKDTLGKIGTIFGLLLSGAGSGLAHQPNAALQMMDKTIQNDLDAQKHSKENAQNFLKINLQQKLQEGQLKKMEFENKLTEAQTGRVGVENQLTRAQVLQLAQQGKLTEAEARKVMIEGNGLAKMQMNRAALHKLTDMVNKLPMGSPQRQQAEAQLAMMFQSVNNENYDIADRAASAAAMANFANQGAGGGPEDAFQAQQRMLRMGGQDKLAEDREKKHIPGLPPSSVDATPENRKEWESLQNLQSGYNDAQDYLNNQADVTGKWLPSSDKAAGESLEKRMELEVGKLEGLGRFTPEEAKRYKSLIPDLTGTHFTGADQAKLNQLKKEVDEKVNNFKSGLGMGSKGSLTQQPKKQKSAGTSEGQTGTYQGKPVIFKNGKWEYR